MARVTVEDCVDKVKNRFELVAIAAQRAKDINAGAPITVDRDNDKDSVVALREIAAEHIQIDALREELVRGFQTKAVVDRMEDIEPEEAEETLEEEFEFVADGASFSISDDEDFAEDNIFEDDDDINDKD